MPSRVRARQKGITGYINAMRPTWLCNPYTIDEFGLDLSLGNYKEYLFWQLDMDEDFAKRFDAIPKDATIGCTCKPENDCHVDIIIEVWNERNKED